MEWMLIAPILGLAKTLAFLWTAIGPAGLTILLAGGLYFGKK